MKKSILFLALFFIFSIVPANADIMPYYTNNIPTNSIGVYQAPKNFKIYKSPDLKSDIVLEGSFDIKNYDCPLSEGSVFLVFKPKRELAFFVVVDENEEWFQVIYDRMAFKKGWIKKDDDARFLIWRNFYNLYGSKYGLYYFKDTPANTKNIYSSTDLSSQVISKITVAPKIKMISVKGNFALVNVLDIDKANKIGFIQWRNNNGEIFLFPNIK